MRIALALLSLLVLRPAPAEPLPPAVLADLPPGYTAPRGEYREALTWSAGVSAPHGTGHAVPDPGAQGGAAWELLPGTDAAEKMALFGPYTDLPAGDYLALFRARLLAPTDDDVVARLDACVDFGRKSLGQRELFTGDLRPDRYTWAPLAFAHPGGKLECRVWWTGYAGLRLERVALYRIVGGPRLTTRAPQPTPTGQPANLPYPAAVRPGPGVWPTTPTPAATLTVADVRPLAADWKLLLLSLQGLVNRREPSLYLILDATDQQWLDWLVQRHWIRGAEPVADPTTLVARYRDRFAGLVLTDPRLPATKNVATMLAGVKDGLIASPRLARTLALPVLDDLHGRFKTNADAYRWAFDTLWPQLDHRVIACLWPHATGGLRDYLVQHKVFTFWLTGPIDGAEPGGDPAAEVKLAEQLLAQMPAGLPVLGFPWAGDDVGIGEGGGVGLFAQFGKFLVGAVDAANLSVHSGFGLAAPDSVVPPSPALDESKVYLTWLMSDGDNLPVLSRGNFPQLWRDPHRGEVPLAWSQSPSAIALLPAVVDYYRRTATPQDAFVTGVSGVGYTYPEQYANRFEPAARTRLFDEFLDLTTTAMASAGIRDAWVMGLERPDLIRRYAERIPQLDALFPDYGRRLARYEDVFYPTAHGVPVFHAATTWGETDTREQKITRLVDDLRRLTPATRPAFLHAFIWNWGADLAVYTEVMRRLGPSYVAVRPEHLSALARTWLAQQQVLVSAPTELLVLGDRPLAVEVTLRNVTARPVTCQMSADELGAPATSVTLPPEAVQVVVLHGQPAGDAIHVRTSGPFGERQAAVRLRAVATAELLGDLPAGELRCTERFDAVPLSHRAGRAVDEPSALAGRVWLAEPAQATAGHIVFGPYRTVPAGRYAALFRVRRTSEGHGLWLRLDTAEAGGATPPSATRELAASDVALGVWRSVPLVFDHPGGALETRVFWSGRGGAAVDTITLWRLGP